MIRRCSKEVMCTPSIPPVVEDLLVSRIKASSVGEAAPRVRIVLPWRWQLPKQLALGRGERGFPREPGAPWAVQAG